MKSTLCLLLCVLAIAGVYSEVNTTNTILVTKGILEGISTVKGWADVSGCITNNEALNAGIADAIATFSVNDTTTVTPAAIKLGKALQKIPLALRNCNNSIAITQNLVQTLSSFASLRDYVQILGNNLVTFQVDLAKGAYQANSFFNQGRLRDFGNRVGQGLAQVFLNGTGKVPPKPDANTTSLYLLIAQGVVEGASVGLRWNEVKACIKESNDSNNDIQSAIQYFQAGDTFSVAQGLAALGAALQDIPASIQDCGVSSTKTKALAQALASLEDATTYFNIVGNNVLINGVDIYDNLNAAYEAFNIGAWKVFGTNVGSATAKLFLDNVPAAKKTVGFLEIDE